MDELVAFVRRCLDDDERVTRQMMAEPGGFYIEAETPSVNIMTVGAHVYRWPPKRVLAEVEAKRAMLDFYESCYDRVLEESAWFVIERSVKLLAQPYVGQDGWDPRWSA